MTVTPENTEADRNLLFQRWMTERGLAGERRPQKLAAYWELYQTDQRIQNHELTEQ